MNKLKEFKYIIIVTLLVIGGAFYWFQYRPSQIKKECSSSSSEKMNQTHREFHTTTSIEEVKKIVYELEYGKCLNERGL